VPTTSTGVDPGIGTAATTTGINVTPGSSPAVTDFYGGWYARDLGYFEVLTYHELKFIEAEAAFRAGNLQRAYDALRAGVRANMVKVGVGGTYSPPPVTFPTITAAQINTYLASAAMPQTPAAVTLPQIMQQKYLAMFLNPDVWSDMRRLDFRSDIYVNFVYPSRANPVLAAGTTATTRFPRRLLPGATEVTYNPTAVAKLFSDAGATANDDYVTKPLWFDMP
jgi:hypothetical protein